MAIEVPKFTVSAATQKVSPRRRLSPMLIAAARDYLQRYGHTQKALATEVGVSQSTISIWLSGGRAGPSEHTDRAVAALCALVGANPRDAFVDQEATC